MKLSWLEKKKCEVDEVISWVEDYGTAYETFGQSSYHHAYIEYLSNGERKTYFYYGTLGEILNELLKVEV